MQGVDADPCATGVNQFPSVGKLAIVIVAFRNIDGRTGVFAAHHAAGVGAVGRDDFSIGEPYVGKKALVTLNQGAADESG